MLRTIGVALIGFALLSATPLTAERPQPNSSALDITLGQSVAPLYGTWKFRIGDSPADPANGKPLWAEPGFDDSAWETVDLTPKEGAFDPLGGTSGYVPGWTARGHAGYSGYAWYRIRVQVRAAGPDGLALEGPPDVDDSYQLFTNGELAGSFGDFTGRTPLSYTARPTLFALAQNTSDPVQVIAFRCWMEPSTLTEGGDPGGMHVAPVMGERGAVALYNEARWIELVRTYLTTAIEAVMFALLSIVAFSLILFDRSDRAYLWMGALFLATAASRGAMVLSSLTLALSLDATNLIAAVFFALTCGLSVMVWWVWFGRSGPRWIPYLTAALAALQLVTAVLSGELIYGIVSHPAALRFGAIDTVVRILLFGVLAGIAVDAIRRRGLDGWLFVPVLILSGVTWFWLEIIALFHVRLYYFPFGVWVSPGLIARFLEAVLIAFLLLRRLRQSIQRQKEMALDVEQAQEVQQVILPEQNIVLNGFEIESDYRPAREVGGDFFQVIPNYADGSVLIVAGDVVGKGLKAGMLVALLVGAIRTAAETSSQPESILAALNRRLLGRADACATCLALLIAGDGQVSLANAGHLPPYINGAPLAVEGSLPLGMIDPYDCSLFKFRMAANDSLLVLSDGVAEAADADGNLFGFDRIADLLSTRPSASRVAEAAQSFGQQDDISVISVTRTAVAEPAIP